MINIAIDGPAGAGKSSIARALCKKLGYTYVDTGSIYRAIAYFSIKHNIAVENLVNNFNNIDIKLCKTGVLLNSEDITDKIRTNDISMLASKVATDENVRNFLVDIQRDIAKNNNVIMDGRDIATVILPGADIKIYLTASAEIRAKRRYKQDSSVDFATLLNSIILRDKQDMERLVAPLKIAPDATVVDNSDISEDDTINLILEIIEKGLNK